MSDEPSLAAVAAALSERFPSLRVEPLRELARGFHSVAVETADGVVFRIARWHAVADGHDIEWSLLPALAPRLPVRVPRPEWRIEPGAEPFPFGAIGYRKLPGVHPSEPSTGLADAVADVLVALHAIPPVELPGLGVADRPPEAFSLDRERVMPALGELLRRDEYARVTRWWDDLLADAVMRTFDAAVCHSDPWHGNLLVDANGELTGVLDWHGASLADPAWDLAAQRYLGPEFFDEVLERYGADASLRHRALRLYELREFGGIRLAKALDDDAELADAVRKLRAGPVLATLRGRLHRRPKG